MQSKEHPFCAGGRSDSFRCSPPKKAPPPNKSTEASSRGFLRAKSSIAQSCQTNGKKFGGNHKQVSSHKISSSLATSAFSTVFSHYFTPLTSCPVIDWLPSQSVEIKSSTFYSQSPTAQRVLYYILFDYSTHTLLRSFLPEVLFQRNTIILIYSWGSEKAPNRITHG